MLKSMTGYGKGVFTLNERRFTFEIKSVNHRYLDINIRLPYVLNFLEDKVKKEISKVMARGKVDIYIGFETLAKDDINITLNTSLADAYIGTLSQIVEKYPVKDEISLALVARFPDVVSVEKCVFTEQTKQEVEEGLFGALTIALNGIVEMRSIEGESLCKDISNKLEYINENISIVESHLPYIQEEYSAKLKAKLDDALAGLAYDEARLLTEVALFADKSSVDEEITRLRSHLVQINEIIKSDDSAGRKLDFVVQEMNREINTIGSKSNDIEISKIVIEIKTSIEKIREQIQNIE
ncbi:MAG: YicC family protein [Defluviitaleaceae bacterium]|nr:YicC family protein [Defluviitaleaceae bacterium]